MRYVVEIPQLAALQRAFRQAPDVVAREVTTAGNKSLVRYQGTAKQKAPVGTSQLRGSLQVTPMTRRGNVIEGAMGTDVNHARWMEEGTGIYGPAKSPIRPRSGKVLAWKSGGTWHYARQVKGSKPHWYMRTSVERNQAATERDFENALEHVTQEIARRVA